MAHPLSLAPALDAAVAASASSGQAASVAPSVPSIRPYWLLLHLHLNIYMIYPVPVCPVSWLLLSLYLHRLCLGCAAAWTNCWCFAYCCHLFYSRCRLATTG